MLRGTTFICTLANSCRKTSKRWQTRPFTLQTRVKSQHTLNLQHGRHSRRVATCVRWSYFMLIAGEETEGAGKIERFGRNRILAEIPPLERTVTPVPFLFFCFLCLCMLETTNPTNRDDLEFPP